ncbi:MAG: WG repeat-containing protein [Crocinitomicaceae bacterium]|nr:WG repeat-containing protein [Crocinitomicaceae bacterium]
MKKLLLLFLIAFIGYTVKAQELTTFEKNGKFGLKNASGEVIVPTKYNYISFFIEGLAHVELKNKWGIIDSTGKLITPLKYDFTGEFEYGVAWVGIKGKYGLIDKKGKEIVSPIFNDVDGFFDDETALVRTKESEDYEGYFTINTKGECSKDCENAPKGYPKTNKEN